MLTIGQAMSKARKEAGVTRRKLSEATGVSVNSIEGYENDRNAPGLLNLLSLADALGITLDEYIDHRVRERSVFEDE